jgi:hypothetical protein
VGSRNDQAILDEAERGEDAAVEAYRNALANKVQRAHDRIRALRDSGRYNR